MRRVLLNGLMLLVLTGLACVTPYQPLGVSGGYQDAKLSPGVYVVEVHGNEYTSGERLARYVVRRALSLCIADGFPYVRMVDPSVATDNSARPPTRDQIYSQDNATTASTTTGDITIGHRVAIAKAVCMTSEEGTAWRGAGVDAR